LKNSIRRIFYDAPLGAAVIGTDWLFMHANRRFCEILGYTEEELMTMTLADITHPEDRAEAIRSAEALAAVGVDRIHMDKRYIQKGGVVVWGRLTPLTMCDPSGAPLYYLSMLEDVTVHRQTIEALRSSKERYSQALHAGNIGGCDWNLRSGELFWSENIDSIFGFKPGEFGRTYGAFLDLLHPDDKARIRDRIRQAVKTGSQFRVEHRIIQPDGTVRWLLEVGDIERNEEGRAVHIFGIIRDIDDRHQAEITLRQSEQYYRALFESAHDPVILFSPRDEVVIDVNQRACEVYGIERSEFIGLSLKSITHDVEVGEEKLDLLLTRGSIDMFESVQTHSDGSPLHLEISASILDYRGSPAILSINRDITDRKRVEEELVKAKESAEAASRAKSDFLAHMSHEIRTPLNAIIGMTDLALETNLDRQQNEFLQTASASADHLLAIVNDVLDLSKVEAGRIELEPRVFALHTLLEELFAAMKPRAREAGLELDFHLQPGVPDTFSGDAGRLRQVLYNLINNAIKFTERGSIELVVALVDTVGDEAILRFAVSDTGIGISPDKFERIFETFSQADGSTTRLFGGTGLGLAISQNLVALMGGEIWVESVEGVGSTFRFTVRLALARVERAIDQPVEERATSAPIGPLRILLAEDFPASQKVAVAILEKRGYEVIVAENGQRAVSEFERQPFDLVLMDVEMPIMDGIEATKTIRELEREGDSRTPIIALTAHAMKGIDERLTAAGMDMVLTKPVRKVNLYAAIDRVTGTSVQGKEP
jgi:PAS domain S-box-containing protein